MTADVAAAPPIRILLVEDNATDVELTLRALKRAKLQNHISIVGDGVAALEFLFNSGQPTPDLVLLDLQLPKIDGREVLTRIRAHQTLGKLPVVILTASDAERERHTALAADAFLTKPVNFERLGDVVREIAALGWSIVKVRE
jgi:CheY-like chemotaxis protein